MHPLGIPLRTVVYRRTFEDSALSQQEDLSGECTKSIVGPLRTMHKVYRDTFEDNVQNL